MTSTVIDTPAILERQIRHQLRIDRKRMTWWIPLIFVAGLVVSALGLVATIAELRNGGSLTPGFFVFAFFTLFFGWAVGLWLFAPLLVRPRVVPYFARELGEYGGAAMAAFRRGRELFRAMPALDRRAEILGVRPLSAFGFAYDPYEQDVVWHAAPEGLQSVTRLLEALRSEEPGAIRALPDLVALSSVLGVAADQGVGFGLVIRLHARESAQAVRTMETRQGSFW